MFKDNTKMVNIIHNYLINRVIQKHNKTILKAVYKHCNKGLL
jgi:hypothetical protein